MAPEDPIAPWFRTGTNFGFKPPFDLEDDHGQEPCKPASTWYYIPNFSTANRVVVADRVRCNGDADHPECRTDPKRSNAHVWVVPAPCVRSQFGAAL